ncbi:MAG TPA: cytochrome b N-terminal domain-containing protein [Thermomicrobiales bacterium]|nr:cytochrome b N-terminal domain-containing protein [Thermomicrobiales bacterium]
MADERNQDKNRDRSQEATPDTRPADRPPAPKTSVPADAEVPGGVIVGVEIPPEAPPTVSEEVHPSNAFTRAGLAAFDWLDFRLGIRSTFVPILVHKSPKVNWWYVFGSATLIAFVMQVVTGVALAFTYVPAPDNAYQSIAWITDDATLGSVVRGIHYWGATAMVLLVFIHMCQVFAFGSFKFPRELNWLSGIVLLLLTISLAFTGQLLRWDQDAYWAVYVMAEQVARVPFIGNWLMQIIIAGETVGGNTLTRFYATHVFLLPAATFALIGIHLYLVIKHGISELPVPGKPVDPKTYGEEYEELLEEEGEPFWPDSAWKDVIAALAIGALVLALAIWPGPKHLGEVADPTLLQTSPRPDWYFLSLFALLALMPPGLEDTLIILGPVLIGLVLILVPFFAGTGERHWRRRPWALGIIACTVVALAVLTYLGDQASWSPDLTPKPLSADVIARADAAGLSRGSTIFQENACINCHRIGDSGGTKGPDLTTVGDRLTQEQLVWRILNGGNGMPAYGETLSTNDVDQVVQFLLQQKQEREEAP